MGGGISGIESGHQNEGLSRREALKRGFKLTGAVLWATPVLQVVNMSRAAAEAVSGPVVVPKICYAVKIDKSSGKACCVDISGQDNPNGRGKCLDVDDFDQAPVVGGCGYVESWRTPKYGDWTVVLKAGCVLDVSGTSFVKSGAMAGFCVPGVNYNPATRTLTFPRPGQNISNVQFAFCCSEPGEFNE